MVRPAPPPSRIAAAGLALLLSGPAAVAADGEEEPGWSDTARITYVVTEGNARTNTVGFKNELRRLWKRYNLTVDTTFLRSESAAEDRTALGTSQSNFVVVDPEKDVSAEDYSLKGKFDAKISDRVYWNTGTSWERNRPSGINNRYTYFAGLGNIWKKGERVLFRTEYDATFTAEDNVIDDPSVEGRTSYGGLRLVLEYRHGFGAGARYGNLLIVDENLSDTDDLRADWTQSLSVKMTRALALEMSLQLRYDNQPAFEDVELFAPPPPGTPTGITVVAPLEELDTIFNAAVVVNF